ncbi:uncharacterized protein PGTG_08851 [Puccinia graminis f. sp. tritici CRL 75-36-700-3]|uniref:Uncharacterized protein n=1 Tax=Puccinia graminis f. sp. tritici (strain CRL 75-36-700-3 / race SCCL) TaxID=418459 RepID=E3KEC2_PUCGT|nr:uncharacterized protein PGTG_08851 [Puccinia graminis f. sp. tritici CRL 75-36-700-3]EFP82655.1 hypothetical protein PGTG_08851 [Puccinia graminis f. sp. tritici CRL 75-36-700-3]
MGDLQSWPTETSVGLQTFGGARLRFIAGDPTRSSRLEFEFARTLHDVVVRRILPPVRFYGPPIKPNVVQLPPKPYQLLQTNNRYLRAQHPQVDLPKSLLLAHILEDQELPEQTEPLISSMLSGLTIDEQHDLIVSVGGTLGNELYCMFLENDQSGLPKLHTNRKPAAILRTPVQQLISGPSLNKDGNAVFLARTHDATTLFTYSHHGTREEPTQTRTTSPAFEFDMSYQLKTSDTAHESHVDSCVAHTINDTLHQFVVLNSKGQLWKVSGIGGNSSLKRIGLMTYSEPKYITWARCGIYPTNDCLVVGLRDSVGMVDPRLNGECSNLYTVSDAQRMTDIQRYINNRTPHLRLINTTSSMIWIDDRKPGVPMLTIKHFRSPDLTLSMSFSAEPEWSPHPSYSLSTAAERFDKVLLWSRTNDVASLHQFKSHPAIPPAVLGYPAAVPVTSSHPLDRRTGLVFFRRKTVDNHLEKFCLVEMKRDGSLWHQQLGLSSSADINPPSTNTHLVERFANYPADVGATGISLGKSNSEGNDGFIDIPKSTLKLDKIWKDFTKSCLSEASSKDDLVPIAVPCIDFMDPLGFCMLPRPYEVSIATNQEITNGIPGSMVDIMPVLRSLLPASANLLPEANTSMDEDEPRLQTYLKQWVGEILTTAIKLSSKTPAPIGQSGEEDDRGSDCGSIVDEPITSLAVDRLMEEWKIGASTSEYQWVDICEPTNEDLAGLSGAESDHPSCPSPSTRSRSQSRFNGIEPVQEVRSSREATTDIVQIVSKALDKSSTNTEMEVMITPKAHPRKSKPIHYSHATPGFPHPSSSLPNPHPSNFLLSSSSQPDPFGPNSLSPPPSTPRLTQAYSQLVPGPHAARSTSTANHSRKKKRVGGF